jgi:hypothetical protein
LSNWLLKEYENENWTLFKIPAIDEQNHSYWPERFPEKALSVIKSMISPYDWESLYQHHFLD